MPDKARRNLRPGLIETFFVFSNNGRSATRPTLIKIPMSCATDRANSHDLRFLSPRLPRRGKYLSQDAADHVGGVCGIRDLWPGFAGAAAALALHAGHEPGGG